MKVIIYFINLNNLNQPIITDKSKGQDRFSKAIRTNVGYGSGGMINFKKQKMVNVSGDNNNENIIKSGKIQAVLSNQQNINYHKILGQKPIKKTLITFK